MLSALQPAVVPAVAAELSTVVAGMLVVVAEMLVVVVGFGLRILGGRRTGRRRLQLRRRGGGCGGEGTLSTE